MRHFSLICCILALSVVTIAQFPRRLVKSHFQIYNEQQQGDPNPMQLQERKSGDARSKPNPQQ